MSSRSRTKRTVDSEAEKPKLVFGVHRICPNCKGKGTKKSEVCRECRGVGFVEM